MAGVFIRSCHFTAAAPDNGVFTQSIVVARSFMRQVLASTRVKHTPHTLSSAASHLTFYIEPVNGKLRLATKVGERRKQYETRFGVAPIDLMFPSWPFVSGRRRRSRRRGWQGRAIFADQSGFRGIKTEPGRRAGHRGGTLSFLPELTFSHAERVRLLH